MWTSSFFFFDLFQHKSIWATTHDQRPGLLSDGGDVWGLRVTVQPSLSVNQSAGALAVTKPFGPEVPGVTRCENKERQKHEQAADFTIPPHQQTSVGSRLTVTSRCWWPSVRFISELVFPTLNSQWLHHSYSLLLCLDQAEMFVILICVDDSNLRNTDS